MAKYRIFIGTYSKGPGKGLLSGVFDSDTGEIRLGDALDIENPSYMQISPYNDGVLYGVSETYEYCGENGGALFCVDISDPGKMRLIDIKGVRGKLPCHLCAVDNLVFTANYSDGSLGIMETDRAGNISPIYRAISHFGKGPNKDRQEAAHIHFVSMTPDGKYLALCDLGLDGVFLYPYTKEAGLAANAKIIGCPPGSGPRHLVFSADGKYMYVLTELASTVLAFGYSDGKAEFLQEISCLPPGNARESAAAAIHISPDGKQLVASNRGADCLAVFDIGENGRLGISGYIEDQNTPRDFNFSPDGNFLVSAHQDGDKIEVFRVENGGFAKVGETGAWAPVCVLFGGQI